MAPLMESLEPLPESPVNLIEMETQTKDELLEVAKELGVSGTASLRKQDLVFRILQARAEREGNYFAGGILEIVPDGFGFLRSDGLRPGLGGDYVMGTVRPPRDSEKYYCLLHVDVVNGLDPETAKRRPYFNQLTPIFPLDLLDLEAGDSNLSTRIINLIAPIRRS